MNTPNTSRKSRPYLLALVMAVVAIVVIVAVVLVVVRPQRGRAAPAATEQQAVPVEVVAVEQVTLSRTVRGIGSLRASQRVELRSEVAGIVRSIPFREGARVDAGHVLFELDDEKLERQVVAREAAVRASEVRLANAQRTFDRQQQLLERGISAQEEFDRAQAELDGAAAELERYAAELALARAQLQDTQIVAPFAGFMSARQVDVGAYVSVGDTLATIYQVDPVELEFSVPERFAAQVEPGQSVEVQVAAMPGTTFEGEIDFVSPAVRVATRDFLVKASIPNPDSVLRPGASATALVRVAENVDRPVVPEEALVATRRGYLVFVVEDGIAVPRDVEMGMRQGGRVEVLEGLSPNEVIVRSGHIRLNGGEPVQVVQEAAPTP